MLKTNFHDKDVEKIFFSTLFFSDMFVHIVKKQFKQQAVKECKNYLEEKPLLICRCFKFEFPTFRMRTVGATKAFPCA